MDYNTPEYMQETGVMDLDSPAEQLGSYGPPPPTPTGSPVPKHNHRQSDESSMSLDEPQQKTRSPVGVVREITPHEADSDGSHAEAEKRVSADDYETMKTVVLEPLGEVEIPDEAHSNWHIADYKKLPDRSYSPEFECGGYKWRILFFPWGNNQKESSSAYIEAIPPSDAPEDWYICAQFAIVMYNPTNPTACRHLSATHRFYAGETDWGFTQFQNVRQSYLRSAHNNETPIAQGGKEVCLTAYVRVVKDSTGVLWHNFRDYDSRKMTGYVGLRNQGATCYMNSLLQSLYFTNAFRKIVFKIPTEGEDPTKSMALALQRVFVQLQTSPEPVSTIGLTQSFGWDVYDSFVQHDAQEFERILLDGLENGMKEAEKKSHAVLSPSADRMELDQTSKGLHEGPLQDQLKRLFCGTVESYIKCVNVDYESSRKEEFWDLQLNVKGCKDLRASFEDLIAVEMMDGDNQYRAEGHGLQDAKKGSRYLVFPPVLHLQLKRFEYDFNRDAIVKINDRYEFPLEIDLGDFIDESAPDKSASWVYKLHSVLVHSGDVHGGHYFGMIKPGKDSKWYRYDDERVIPVTIDDVLEENFGGDGGYSAFSGMNGILNAQTRMAKNAAQWKRFTSAYMLVYLREAVIDELLAPIMPADIPKHVSQQVEYERNEELRRRREKEEMHLYVHMRVIDVQTFRHHDGVDLASFDPQDVEAQEWIYPFRIRRDSSWAGVYQIIADAYRTKPDFIRLWHLVNRQNKTIRPDIPVPPDPNLTVEAWMKTTSARGSDLKMYLEKAEDIWHPTVAVLPKRIPTTPASVVSPPRYSEEFKDTKDSQPLSSSGNNSSQSLANGEHEQPNGAELVDWPEVGKLPGVYNSRHDANMILIFLKWFDVDNQRLRGMGPIYVHRQDKTGKLSPIVAEMMGWKQEPGEPPVSIAFYEEIKPGMIEILKPNNTFTGSEIQDGDIVCFMRTLSQKRIEELTAENKFKEPVSFYDFLNNKIILTFRPRSEQQLVKEEFQCVLSKTMKYEQIAAKVAEHLKVQPTHLRFFPSTVDGKSARPTAIKRIITQGYVINQFLSAGALSCPPIAYYEVLEMSLVDVESRRDVTISWLPDGIATVENVKLSVSRQATCEEVIAELVKKQTSISSEVYNRIRLFDARQYHTYKEFLPSQALTTGPMDSTFIPTFYAEVIPLEEIDMGEMDRCVIVIHFTKDLHRTHSIPVKFVIKPGELWYDTKKRLQKRLGYKDKDFSKIKFFSVPVDGFYAQKTIPLEDEDIVYDRLVDKLGKEFIALDHPDRSPNRKPGFGEKALTIKS